ncbi:MAG: 16S rRNA (cytosine(1402)-N(4))-methyltransferase RsmH [Candidatus Aminicenantes bacterium]|nr:16S rRNA (cytosine(1402)-N(4))-methyltransferase RsmH [Candidatus Aminicenantes bacterium]
MPVLVNEVVELLRAAEGGIFFDGTVGLGGHSAAVLEAAPGNFLYGTDRDIEALELTRERLAGFSGRYEFFKADFREIESLPIEIGKIDGFLFDLGVSSFQLDEPGRGFSYSQSAPLDMRMDKEQSLTACEVVNSYSYRELCEILKKYGEIGGPVKIVEQIVFHRKNKRIESSADLKEIVRRIYPRKRTMDPLSRVFQALRIEVNRELAGLEDFFIELFPKMKTGARIVIISFHSLEDRIAKNALRKGKEAGLIEILTKKPITASEVEKAENARSRSAKLRGGRKC